MMDLKDQRKEAAILLITHDLEVAKSAQRRITLRDGRVDSDLSR